LDNIFIDEKLRNEIVIYFQRKNFQFFNYDNEHEIILLSADDQNACLAKAGNYLIFCTYSHSYKMQNFEGNHIQQNLEMVLKAIETCRFKIINI
jgi:hypothetical protein